MTDVKLAKAQTVIKPIPQVETFSNEPDVPKGKVYVVMVKADGTEKPDSGFLIGEATYLKVYANNPKFKLKKKHSE